jgi:hypothetical protein
VTHTKDEAMELADLIVVMLMGRIEQIGTPHEVRSRTPRRRPIAPDLTPADLRQVLARLPSVRLGIVSIARYGRAGIKTSGEHGKSDCVGGGIARRDRSSRAEGIRW